MLQVTVSERVLDDDLEIVVGYGLRFSILTTLYINIITFADVVPPANVIAQFSATDCYGNPLTGLKISDFILKENRSVFRENIYVNHSLHIHPVATPTH
jgi:hypothetical protein